MKTIQLKCKAFTGEKSKINTIAIDESGTVRVWDAVAKHYTTCHALTARTLAKIRSN